MVTAIGILMAIVAISIVAYPVFRPRTASSRAIGPSPDQDLGELLTRRDATYATLKELDLDLEVSKLSPADYQALRNRYRAQAVGILQELDAYQAGLQTADGDQPAQEIEPEATPRQGGRRDPPHCPECGSAYDPDDSFCRRCGRTLAGEFAD